MFLCYIDEIPETYHDWDEHSKYIMGTPEYKEYIVKRHTYFDNLLKIHHSYSSRDMNLYDREHDPNRRFEIHLKKYPHPDYEAGYTHYLYFTDDMSKQDGDDWNDAPYEYNAGLPYDDECKITVFKFNFYPELKDYISVAFPKDHRINSPYSVEDINNGAVAWVYLKRGDKRVAIHGGDELETVITKLRLIYGDLIKDFKQSIENF